MNVKLRGQPAKIAYILIAAIALASYFISLWSIGLAVAFSVALCTWTLTQLIIKSQHLTLKAQDQVFRQFEYLKQLYYAIKPREPLPCTRGYAASPDLLVTIYQKILDNKPKTILEGSSGLSTLVSSYAAERVGHCKIISLEHEPLYRDISQSNLEKHGLAHIAHVYHAPITTHTINGQDWKWYDFSAADIPDEIDLIIIDGPPKRLQKHARYPALPLLIDKLSPGGQLLLDDADRKQEQEIAQLWSSEYSNIKLEHIPLEKGLLVVTKQPS